MTSEIFIHNIVLWVLSAETKEECVKRFEAVINNPKLCAFIKDYQNRRLICDEIIARYNK